MPVETRGTETSQYPEEENGNKTQSSSTSNSIEEELLYALKFSSGLDRNKLSELVKIATHLFEGVDQKDATSEMNTGTSLGAKSTLSVFRWWIYGVPALDRIGFQSTVTEKGIQTIVNNISNKSNVKAALDRIELIPGSISAQGGSQPIPWMVKGSLGAKSSI